MEQTEVAIIGSGFSGICMGIKLKQAGIHDFVILEKDDDLGGTWRDNTYPGCACDIPSYLYSFSFAPNPGWTRMFAPWDEILGYLRDCADRFGIIPHIRYGADVTGASYSDGSWTVQVNGDDALTARALVTGVGALHDARVPDLPGIGSFAGTAFHSAHWNHTHDLNGRRVAVIGTGASAIQFVPRIAPQVERLTVFQRTAPWVTPKPDRAIGPRERAVHTRFPAGQRALRNAVYLAMELRGLGFALSPKLMKPLEVQARRHLQKQVTDPGLRARLTPDYQIGCKRMLFSSDYYPTFSRDNVDLVTERISRVTPGGVVTADGTEHPCDTLVLATGFRVSGSLTRMRITGRDGADLNDEWKRDGHAAHLGITVSGFPNLFLLVGPNTTLGHSSMVFMIEAQVRYVLQAIRLLHAGTPAVEVRPDVQDRFVSAVRDKLDSTVWQSGCASWYLDERGRNTTIWPRFTFDYWWRTRQLDAGEYVVGPG